MGSFGLACWDNKAIEINPDLANFYESSDPSAEDYNKLGKVLRSQKRYLESIEAYNNAIQRLDSTNQELAAAIYNNLGVAQQEQGDQESAISSYRQATQLNPTFAQYINLAGVLTLAQRWDEVIEVYRQFEVKLSEIEKMPASITDASKLGTLNIDQNKFREYSDRAIYFADNQAYYYYYANQLMKALPANTMIEPGVSKEVRALEVSERARVRSFLEMLAQAQANQVDDPQLSQRKIDLERQWQTLANQLLSSGQSAYTHSTESQEQISPSEMVNQEPIQTIDEQSFDNHSVKDTSGSSLSPTESLQMRENLDRASQDYALLIQEIRDKEPRYGELNPPTPVTIAQVQQLLDDSTLLLEYQMGTPTSYMWVVSKDDVKSYELPERKKIEQVAKRFYEYLTVPSLRIQSNNTLEIGLELSQMILGEAKADQHLDGKRLVIVADGWLQYIPFNALPTPQVDEINWRHPPKLLIENYEIVNIPSASTLVLMGNRIANRLIAPKSLALIFDSQLPGVQQEVKAIQEEASNERIGDASVLLGDEFDATRRTILEGELSQYRLIHFAMHGVLNDADPAASGFRIFPNNPNSDSLSSSNLIKLADVFNIPPLYADLVVLSGCRTGLGSEVRGEGLIGLTKGFMYAGAERVLVSLWSIDDFATASLMSHFYDNLIDKNQSPAKALREAQLEMFYSDEWHGIYNWASFTLQGDWLKLREKL